MIETEDNSTPLYGDEVYEQLFRGEQFAVLLRDGVFNQAVREAKLSLFEQISDSEQHNVKQREECYIIIKALQRIEAAMTECVSNAIALQEQIDNDMENE